MPPRKRKAPASRRPNELACIDEDVPVNAQDEAKLSLDLALSRIENQVQEQCTDIISAARHAATAFRSQFEGHIARLAKKARDMPVSSLLGLSADQSKGHTLSPVLRLAALLSTPAPTQAPAGHVTMEQGVAGPGFVDMMDTGNAPGQACADCDKSGLQIGPGASALPLAAQVLAADARNDSHDAEQQCLPQGADAFAAQRAASPVQARASTRSRQKAVNTATPAVRSRRTRQGTAEVSQMLQTPMAEAPGAGEPVMPGSSRLTGFALRTRTVAATRGRQARQASSVDEAIMISTYDGQQFLVDADLGLAGVPEQYRGEVAAQLEVMQRLVAAALMKR